MNPLIPLNEGTGDGLGDIPINPELVGWLERTIPERCPGPLDAERNIWMYAGKRELVRALAQAHRNRQARTQL